jgi:hypothetical protein
LILGGFGRGHGNRQGLLLLSYRLAQPYLYTGSKAQTVNELDLR